MNVLTPAQIASAKLARVLVKDIKPGDKVVVLGSVGDDYGVIKSTSTIRVPRTVYHQGLRIDINRAAFVTLVTTTGRRAGLWADDTMTVLTF